MIITCKTRTLLKQPENSPILMDADMNIIGLQIFFLLQHAS